MPRVPEYMEKVPEDIEAERSLLATCCAEGYEHLAMEAWEGLNVADFMNPRHQLIFQAMGDLLAKSTPIHALTLKDQLGSRLPRIGGWEGLLSVLAGGECGSATPLIKTLRRHARRRKLIDIGWKTIKEAENDDCDPHQLASSLLCSIADLTSTPTKNDLQLFGDVGRDVLSNKTNGKPTSTGFSKLDYKLRGGFRPGQLIVLAARPRVGKSALALQLAINVATKAHKPVGFFSIEMSKEDVWKRAVSIKSHVPIDFIENGYVSDNQEDAARRANMDLNASRLMISESPVINVENASLIIDRHRSRMEGDFALIVIDYLQIMDATKDRNINESLRIGRITSHLKRKAKEWNCAVVLLSQLNRDIEKRADGVPQLSDLRDSGSIESDADIVMFIHRKIKPTDDEHPPDCKADLMIAKHRGGPEGVIHMHFDGPTTTFSETETGSHVSREPDGFGDDCY